MSVQPDGGSTGMFSGGVDIFGTLFGGGSVTSGGGSTYDGGFGTTSSGGGALGGAASGAGLGMTFGPWGAAVGGALGFLQGIFGDITMAGWSISCIGSQAYKNADLNRDMADLETRKNQVNGSNLQQVQGFLNFCSDHASLGEKAISNYRSSCSKALRQKLVDAYKAALSTIRPHYTMTSQMVTKNNEFEGSYSFPQFTVTGMITPTGSGGSVPLGSGGVNPAGGGVTYTPPVTSDPVRDLTPADTSILGALFPALFGGGVAAPAPAPAPVDMSSNIQPVYDSSGNIDFTSPDGLDVGVSGSIGGWNFGLNNQKDNTLLYVGGVAAFALLYSYINKKK